jgi:hypothetical protein
MPDQGVTVPPVSGIARRRRSDAGIPRASTMDALYDRFLDLTLEQQRVTLDVLTILHRQTERGRIKPPAASAEGETDNEQP